MIISAQMLLILDTHRHEEGKNNILVYRLDMLTYSVQCPGRGILPWGEVGGGGGWITFCPIVSRVSGGT